MRRQRRPVRLIKRANLIRGISRKSAPQGAAAIIFKGKIAMNDNNGNGSKALAFPNYGDIIVTKDTQSLQIALDSILRNPECFEKIRPYYAAEVCGHKMMDMKVIVDIVRKFDGDNLLQRFPMNDNRLSHAINNRMRTRYTLDKRWKIAGLNEKRVAPKEQQAAA